MMELPEHLPSIQLKPEGVSKTMNIRLKLHQPKRLKANESLRILLQQGRLLAAAETSTACSKAVRGN